MAKYPRKILLANSYYAPDEVGGAEVVTRVLAETLRNLGYDVVVLTSGLQDRVENRAGVRVYRVYHRNLYWGKDHAAQPSWRKPFWHTLNVVNPLLLRKFEAILAHERPEVLHTHNLASLSYALWLAAKKQKIPVVHTLHDYALLCIKSTMFKNRKNCQTLCPSCRGLWIWKRRLTQWVHHVVSVSQFVLNQHRKFGLFRDTPATVIYNPIPPDLKPQPHKMHRPVVFGYIGRLHESKGIEELLRAFQSLPYRLKIAGTSADPAYEIWLKRTFGRPHIEFLGYQKAQTFYPQIDVLIVPSLWNDPSPTVVHEANAYGIPVLASRRGGLAEIVQPEVNGYLYDPEDPNALKQWVERLATHPQKIQTLSMNAFEHARAFVPLRVVEQYLSVYRTVWEQGSPTHRI